MKRNQLLSNLRNQRGATAIMVSSAMVMLVGFVALAIDLSHLYVVKNELQNAADAGALAGAQALYSAAKGTAVDPNANQIAYAAATANNSEGVAVELYNYTENSCPDVDIDDDAHEDVQRGHWAFASSDSDYKVDESNFECNNSLEALNLADYSTAQLNADENFINAVKVVTRRKATPIVSFFAKIFGYENFQMSAEAIAYIGFAGLDTEVTLPIAICAESITDSSGKLIDCNIGRMYPAPGDTARWTSLKSPDESTSTNTIRPLLPCNQNYEGPTFLTEPVIGTTEGAVDTLCQELRTCWEIAENEIVINNGENPVTTVPVSIDEDKDGIPDQPWSVTLPVIYCTEVPDTGETVGPTWGPVRSVVKIEIAWISDKDKIENAPEKMNYDISKTSDGINFDNGNSWPDGTSPSAESGTPWDELIVNPDETYDSGSSIYEIMKFFAENDVNTCKQAFDDLNAWGQAQQFEQQPPDDWDNTKYPFWATQVTVGDVFNQGIVRWASFVKHFNLKDQLGNWAFHNANTIYFKPSCEETSPTGHNGVDNFGILAKYPVLVK